MKRKHPPTISDDDDGEDYEQEPEQGDDEVDEEEEEENGRTDPGEETDMAAYGGHRRYPTRSRRAQRANGSNGIIGRAMPRRSERKKRREHYGGHSPSTPTKTMQIQRLPPNPVLDTRRQSSRPRHHRHRKLDHHCSSSSTTGSSTSSSSGDERRGNNNGRGGGGGKHSRRKSKRMEEKFEQRKLKSLMKGRKELMPINITEKEAEGSVLNIVRERVRRMNSSSCADIDPMSVDQSVGFDQVGGLSRHIQQLKEMCLFPMLYPHVFDHFAIQPPKGVLFYGPPGTGKTLIARALANECGRATAGGDDARRHRVAFFMRKGADCLSKWVGESERQLRLLFDQAYRMRPSIIFFDEIDGLAPVRSSRQDQIHSSIVSTLLALMDGIDARGEVIVIGATNRLDTIDPALRRPGRFDRELRFDLPDASTRQQILHIHTRSWPEENRVPAKLLQWLAEQSSGYCGADLKALCTEAVLIAMRERYPHMYLSAEKLLLEPGQIHVERQHFEAALRQIVPASRRDGVLFTSALSNRHSAASLIQPVVEQLLEGRVPAGYQRKAGQNDFEGDNIGELERVVMALAPSTVVPAARVLLNGSGRFGQGTHFLPALLARLDHLPVFLVSSERVFSGGIGGPPEEQIAQTVRQALRATAQGTPVVLAMPDMDLLEQTLPVAAWKMLVSSLNVFSGSTSALVLAAVQSDYEELSPDMKQSFRPQQAFPIGTPKRKAMRAFFDSVMLEQARQQPFQFRAENYPEPPRAPADDPRPVRRMGKAECLELEKMYTQMLRQFRIFLRDLLRQLVRDQRFKCFHLPVDPKDVEDYYAIVQRPMCLSQMMANIDADKYHTAEAFLDDLRLIRDNAIEYNPDKEMEDITIKHTGKWLVEMAEAMIDMEMDDDFPAKLEEARLLVEEGKRSLAQEGNGPALEKRQQDSATTTVGKKYVNFANGNGTHPRLTNGHGPTTRLVAKEEPEEEEAEEEDDDDEEFTPNGGMAAASSSCTRPSRSAPSTTSSSSAALSLKKRAQSMGTAAAAMMTARKRGRKPRQASNGNRASSPSKQLANGTGKSSPPSIFILDETALRAIGEQAADKACSNFWGIQDVENLGAELELIISKYSQQWDRSGLPQELRQCIDDFQL